MSASRKPQYGGGVGDPPGLTHPPTGPGWARPRDSLTPSHAPGYPLTPGGGGGGGGGGMGSGAAGWAARWR